MLEAIFQHITGLRLVFNNHSNKNFELFAEGCYAADNSIMTIAGPKVIMEATKFKGRSLVVMTTTTAPYLPT